MNIPLKVSTGIQFFSPGFILIEFFQQTLKKNIGNTEGQEAGLHARQGEGVQGQPGEEGGQPSQKWRRRHHP
jgi:hypothetical protein